MHSSFTQPKYSVFCSSVQDLYHSNPLDDLNTHIHCNALPRKYNKILSYIVTICIDKCYQLLCICYTLTLNQVGKDFQIGL